jgi:hypothetical protein
MAFETDIAKARGWVEQRVKDGSLGRLKNTYKPDLDSLTDHQNELSKGYDSTTMQPSLQQNQAALQGGTAAFAGKMAGGSGAMAPQLLQSQQLYNTGLTADNYGAKQRGLAGYGSMLQNNQARDLQGQQYNLDQLGREHALRAALPFDLTNSIQALRTAKRGGQNAYGLVNNLSGY